MRGLWMTSAFRLSLAAAISAAACAPNRQAAAKPTPEQIQHAIAEQAAVHSYFLAVCEHDLKCYRGDSSSFGDPETCASLAKAPPAFGQLWFPVAVLMSLPADVDAGRVKVDLSKVTDCTNAIIALECNDTSLSGISEYKLPLCFAAFEGTVAAGGPCTEHFECSGTTTGCFSPTSFSSGPSCDPGNCGEFGVGCDYDYQCAAGMVCVQAKCVAPNPPAGANGAPCGEDRSCQTGLWCLGADAGACQALAVDAGDHCDDYYGCAGNLSCDLDASICVPLAGLNESCVSNWCTSPLLCVPEDGVDGGISWVCMNSASKGQPCMETYQCGGQTALTVCDPDSHVCVDRQYPWTCSTPNQCGINQTCDIPDGGKTGICIPSEACPVP